jgi:hypothetical protein
MYIWSAIPELHKATGMDLAQLSRYMQRLNLGLIAAAPLEYVLELFRASNSYWFPAVTIVAGMHSKALLMGWSVLHFGFVGIFVIQAYLATGAMALAGARWRLRKKVSLIDALGFTPAGMLAYTLGGTIVIYTMAVSVVVESGVSRVRTPADIFMVLMIPIGLRAWRQMVTQGDVTTAAPETVRATYGRQAEVESRQAVR